MSAPRDTGIPAGGAAGREGPGEAAGPDGRERTRASARFRAAIHAEILLDDGSAHPAEVANLSRGGVLMSVAAEPGSGSVVTCTLHAPIGELRLLTRGRVVRVTPSDEEPEQRYVAVEFLDLGPEERQVLEALISRVLEGQALVPLDDLRPGAPAAEVRKALEKIPLPHRIALALRAPTPREREHLRQDTHPQVLEALCRNSNMLPPEAREIAKSHHITAQIIELLSRDPRWSGDEELRVLLCTHARAPAHLAERLLTGLTPVGLRRALQRPGLSDAMRNRILFKLKRRR